MSHDLLSKTQKLLLDEEKAFLDKNGYLSLGKLLNDDQLETIRTRVDSILQQEGDQAGSELFNSKHIKHPKEEGADRLANLVNKGEAFDELYTLPKLLAAVTHVLGNQIQLSSLNYRAALPGNGLQKLHVDWKEPVAPDEFKVCNSIWLLDDFTETNGATRVVPGSHLLGRVPEDDMEAPEASHPNQILIQAPAGTVVVFNSHIWHGGTVNRTNLPRRSIHSYFCQRDQPQQTDQRNWITNETLNRITPQARWLLNV